VRREDASGCDLVPFLPDQGAFAVLINAVVALVALVSGWPSLTS
jgi:hypothetical protein